jgi:hypothetical protein
MIKDSFLTVAYKQGWIHSYNWRSITTGKSGERIHIHQLTAQVSIGYN